MTNPRQTMKRPQFENVLLLVTAVCAFATTGMLVRREFFPKARASSNEPRAVAASAEYARLGHRLGRTATPVEVVVFGDFQCPACRALAAVTDSIRSQRPQDVSFIERHYPIESIHPVARTAALVAECAYAMGNYEGAFHALFEMQRSLSSRPWAKVAMSAGLDSLKLQDCVHNETGSQAVEADIAAGDRLALAATPSFLVNGKLYQGTVSLATMNTLINETLASQGRR
jgi:protein-disulfide isomerase